MTAPFGIMPDLGNRMFQTGPAFKHNRSVLLEDRPAARPALIIALVGDGEMIVIQPFHRIRLTQAVRLRFGEIERPFTLGIHTFQRDSTGTEMVCHHTIGTDHHDMVVFLQGHRNLAVRVHRHKFRLRVIARNPRQPDHLDARQPGAIHNPIFQRQLHHKARWHLRDCPVIHLLVALILDGNRKERPIRCFRHRIRLPAQIAFRHQGPGCQINCHQLTRGCCKTFRRVHTRKGKPANNLRRCRLATYGHIPQRLWCLRIGDVDQPQHPQRAVGINQHHPILRCRNNLRARHPRAIFAVCHVPWHSKGGDAVKILLCHCRHRCHHRQNRGQSKKPCCHNQVPMRLIALGFGQLR